MLDLVALAYQADITRVFTMIFARELSSRTFPNIGVPEQHHPSSHHRNDPELIAKKAKIDTYHVQLLTYFLTKLQATRDGDGSLLDQQPDHVRRRHGRRQSAPAFGSALPAGRQASAAGSRPAVTWRIRWTHPMANLLLTILDKAGVRIDKIGDSTGRLQPDYLSLI